MCLLYAVGNKLYVSNISFQTSREDLESHFRNMGCTILDVYIPLDRETGDPRGFSFVTLAKEDVERALEEGNGSELNGRTLSVSIPLPKGQKSPGREKPSELRGSCAEYMLVCWFRFAIPNK